MRKVKASVIILILLISLVGCSDTNGTTKTYNANPEPIETSEPVELEFVGSIESDKYHYPDCRWAEKILEENELWFSTIEEAQDEGYIPC